MPEFMDNGCLVSRHLDDKAGVAAMLAAARAICESDAKLPMDCHLLFTIAEEVGVGASTVLHGDVRSEEHTSEPQSLMRISYAVFCLKKITNNAELSLSRH